ncbi:MAG: alpha/beta hydrolase [Flavobacterium sp.]|nr:alpha/beta hydrolase [Flavobacterium sp.]
MNFIKNNKIKSVIGLLILFYILICQSCATMRMDIKETKSFFGTSKIVYLDSTIVVGKFKIHYIQTGNKNLPTLFFVHGSPGSWDAFKDYLKDTLLLKKYRMIAIDRPGFGYSDFGDSKNLFEQGAILEQFVDKIKNGKNLYLVGHSYGGPTIVKMAVDKPNDFKEIVILAGAIDPKAETPEKWRTLFKAAPLRFIVPGALRPANDELWWLKTDLKFMEPTLKKITADVLVIHGTLDPLVPYSNVAFIEREFINAKSIQVISIKNANHFIPWEHYDLIRNELLKLKE